MKTLSDIQAAKVTAMKEGRKFEATVLSLLINEVQKIAKEDRNALNRAPTEADVITAARRNIKKAEETLTYAKAQVAEDLRNEIKIYSEFLPDQLTPQEFKFAVRLAVASVPYEKRDKIGEIMKYMNEHYAGRFNSKEVKAAHEEALKA